MPTVTCLQSGRRLCGLVLLTATISAASACADTENRFIAAKLTGPAGDITESEASSSEEDEAPGQESSSTRGTDAAQGKPAPSNASSPSTPNAKPSGAMNPVLSGQAGSPAAPSSANPTQAAAGTPAPDELDAGPGVDPEDSAVCSVELTACVLLNGPIVDGCLDDFSRCRGVLDMADGGPESACALQLTSCLLADATNAPACDEKYQECVKAIP